MLKFKVVAVLAVLIGAIGTTVTVGAAKVHATGCAPLRPHAIHPNTPPAYDWVGGNSGEAMSVDANWTIGGCGVAPGPGDAAVFQGDCNSCTTDPSNDGAFSVADIEFTNGTHGFTIRDGGGTIAISDQILAESDSADEIETVISGAGAVSITGTLRLTRINTYTGGTTVTGGGILDLMGTGQVGEVTLAANSRIQEGGTIGTLNSTSGYLSTGDGTINVTSVGSVTNTEYYIALDGTGNGTHSLMNVGSSIDLSNWTLGGKNGFSPSGGDVITILHATGTIDNTFQGYSNGSTVTIDGQSYRINYTTHDVTLTATTSAPAEFALSVSPSRAVAGDSVTLTATVEAADGRPVPTGTVTFFDGSKNLGTATLVGDPHASVTIHDIAAGKHNFHAVYDGDKNTSSATSDVVTDTVHSGATPVPEAGTGSGGGALELILLGSAVIWRVRRRYA